MSDDDIKKMACSDSEISIIIKILSRKRERLEWVNKSDRGIKGSYGDYVIDMNVYRIQKDQTIPESLQIVTPAAIKALNRENMKKLR